MVGWGSQRSADSDGGRESPDGWQSLSAELNLETGLAVFANPFSCGLTAQELTRLREIGASKSRLAFVLLVTEHDDWPLVTGRTQKKGEA